MVGGQVLHLSFLRVWHHASRRGWGRWLAAALLCLGLPSTSCARETDAGGDGARSPAQTPGPFRAVVVHVDDGDTLDVRAGAQSFRLRLNGVDAPEIDQRFGIESRNRLRALIFDRTVDVRPVGVDRYGRLLACPTVDRQNVCETMVAEGWAWHYRQYSSDARLSALEKQAREARRGLWSEPDAMPPWELRAQERADDPARAGRGAPAGPFHGNVKSRVYHAPGCPDYDCASCSAVFATREAAESAGFRAHRECVR